MKLKPVAVVLVVLAAIPLVWWLLPEEGPSADDETHAHELVPMADTDGTIYYSCPMHPQVRQHEPGNCPICGMKLVKREERPSAAAGAGAEAGTVLYWYDPMRPDQHFDAPGKSPFMDMQLVPKYASASSGTIVEIDPRMAQNLGVRTAPVTAGTFWRRVDTVGAFAVNEHRIVTVEARAAGWVERLVVRAVGESVARGQVVAEVYAPELRAAEEELALAQQLDDAGLIGAARTRLDLLGVGSRDVAAQPRRVPIAAPQAGVITQLFVREGAQIAPSMPLMQIADLDSVWLAVEVPEAQSTWVTVGKPAEARTTALPGRVFKGTVDYVYPILDSRTRTARARLVFDNANGLLKPGMYADVTVFGGAVRDAIIVPSEAVIRTGLRNVVIVAESAGRYRPVEVVLGDERRGQTIVLSGLAVGDAVVVSGQFLIDSEASLLGAYQRLSDDSPAARMRLMGKESGPSVYGEGSSGEPQ